jgi:hypothetical protein
VAVLENHGYLLAEAAIKRWLPDLATGDPALRIPHPAWMDEARVQTALRSSAKRTFFGR